VEDVDPEDDGTAVSWVLADTDDDEEGQADPGFDSEGEDDDELALPDMLPGSAEEREFIDNMSVLLKVCPCDLYFTS
jgi:hypothetical protein